MKVNGIIAEYNPFHSGHQYHLEEALKQTGADYTIIVMSGNFVQRGAPALIDKYKRAEMALRSGADLVLELPVFYAAASAEYFAAGAVSILEQLGVVTHLCFGSECGDIDILDKLARILLEEPEQYISVLRSKLRQGYSYPIARNAALIQFSPELSKNSDVLRSPNNILGIEYIKALLRQNSQITPHTTLRIGSDYHEQLLGENQSSALAIRQAIYSRQDFDFLKSQMPASAYEILASTLGQSRPVSINDFSSMLYYKLLSEYEKGYDAYQDVSSDLSDRIRNHIYDFTNFRNFCDLLKSKDVTYTRISRCLLHILLDMDKVSMEQYKSLNYVPYAKVLGFRRNSASLLNVIKSRSSIPLITKLADARHYLSPDALAMLQKDIKISQIYQSALASKIRKTMQNEYRTPIVII